MRGTKRTFALPDLVMLGVYNAALLLGYYGVIIVLHFFPVLWGAMDPAINFALAPIYLLMLARVPKNGVMTLHGAIIGLAHLATGWWPGLIAGLAAGVSADGIARIMGGYGRKAAAPTGILVFATIKAMIFYCPLYLFSYFPVFSDVLSMWPREFIEEYTVFYAVGFLGVNGIACAAGLYWGRRILRKNFENFTVCPEK